jgi:hypothetical protein
VKDADEGWTPLLPVADTELGKPVALNSVPQPLSEYIENFIVPVGLAPPERVAVSVAEPPMIIMPELESRVATEGVALIAVRAKVPELSAWFVSPP